MGKAFWIGLIGGFLGFVGGIVAIIAGSISAAYEVSSQAGTLYGLAAGAFVFSIIGIVGGIFERKRVIGGVLMLVAAFGVLISINLFGVLPFLFFLVGAILIFARKSEHEIVTHQPSVAHSQSFAESQAPYGVPQQQPDQSSMPETAPVTGQGSYTVCGTCGRKLAPHSKFCSGCGATIE